jgi:hypothetical protein
MRIKKCLRPGIFLLFLLLLAGQVQADVEISIDIEPEFSIGDIVNYSYTFLSDESAEISYIASIDCPDALLPLLGFKNATLVKDVAYSHEFEFFEITEDIDSQECVAIVSIGEPFNQSAEESFKIVTDLELEFSTIACIDRACTEESNVFELGSVVFLDFVSDVENPVVTATLTYPDGSQDEINLPWSISAEEVGTYTLQATASRNYYRDSSYVYQFAVIEKEIEIESETECNGNGICEDNEDSQNCPQDCPLAAVVSEEPGQVCIKDGVCSEEENFINCFDDCTSDLIRTYFLIIVIMLMLFAAMYLSLRNGKKHKRGSFFTRTIKKKLSRRK